MLTFQPCLFVNLDLAVLLGLSYPEKLFHLEEGEEEEEEEEEKDEEEEEEEDDELLFSLPLES